MFVRAQAKRRETYLRVLTIGMFLLSGVLLAISLWLLFGQSAVQPGGFVP